jgi:hypothetical protein
VLWNSNYFLRFRFRLLKSYGSGYGPNCCQVTVPVPYLDHKSTDFKKVFEKNLAFLHSKLFYKERIDKFHQIYCKMWMKKILNEGNHLIKYTILYCAFVRTFHYGSGTVINYGSGSNFLTSYGSGSKRQKVTVPTVPQHCLYTPFFFVFGLWMHSINSVPACCSLVGDPPERGSGRRGPRGTGPRHATSGRRGPKSSLLSPESSLSSSSLWVGWST